MFVAGDSGSFKYKRRPRNNLAGVDGIDGSGGRIRTCDRCIGIDVITLCCYDVIMNEKPKRTTIYFDAETLRALKMKAVVMERSVSYLVNDAVKAIEERGGEPDLDFEDVVKDMKRRGRL